MKTVLCLAALVAFTLAGTVPETSYEHVKTKAVDADFLVKQKKLFSLLRRSKQVDYSADYYKVGFEYKVEDHVDDYTDKHAVEEFLYYWKQGVFTPKNFVFSIINDKQRPEAVALFNLFFYAKDFETFYKTAAFAKVYMNEGLFLYTYYVAVYQHDATQGMILPPPYEVYPEFFFNKDVLVKVQRTKSQHDLLKGDAAEQFGIYKEDKDFIFYANYSNYLVYNNEEQRLSYFTEDVGMNAFYYYFHNAFPFWHQGYGLKYDLFKERFGEIKHFTYNQLLSRYYMERLSNGLGEIPHFSWYAPIKTGYYPAIQTPFYPFMMRNNYYNAYTEQNYDNIQFLDTFEKLFEQYLQQGYYKADEHVVDLYNSKSFNWIADYWFLGAKNKKDAFTAAKSYEVVGRHVLSAAPVPAYKNDFIPSALDFYQTSMRDPVFWQFYGKIYQNVVKAMKFWKPYTKDALQFAGVKINDVNIDKLVTYFDIFEMDASNAVYRSEEELKSDNTVYKIRQPRLNHKPFTVTVDIKSDVEKEAVVKFFLGPKYGSNGLPISIEDNWMNFMELDMFRYKLSAGSNKIERHSYEFALFQEDDLPAAELYKLFEQGKMPEEKFAGSEYMPNRMMLPKGRKGGFPLQVFVIVYPADEIPKEFKDYEPFVVDTKHFIYPFDRPVKNFNYFVQPNMFFKDVLVYHEGEMFPYYYSSPYYLAHHNEVPKH